MRLAPAFVVVLACSGTPKVGTDTVVRPSAQVYDRDHDGIADDVDQCPDVAEDLDGFEDGDGCPDLDNDQDGIADHDDHCPNEPEDKDGFQDNDGCPDLDNDKDGILDKDDMCPNEPETYNGYQDEDGCPDKGVVIVTSNPPMVFGVTFADGSAAVPKDAGPLLSEVTKVLAGHPEILTVQIEGHADPKEKGAVALSEKRAQAVLADLVARSVDPKRLRGKGFGGYCPVDPNSPAKNRRITFKVVRTTSGVVGGELGCAPATAAGLVSDPP